MRNLVLPVRFLGQCTSSGLPAWAGSCWGWSLVWGWSLSHSIGCCTAQMANSVLRLWAWMHNQGQWGCAICKVCRSSLCTQSFLCWVGWASFCDEALRGLSASWSGTSTMCCSGHGWSSSPRSGMLLLASRALSSHSSTANVLVWRHLGDHVGKCCSHQRWLNHHGVGLLCGLYLPELIFSRCWCCLPLKGWLITAMVPSGGLSTGWCSQGNFWDCKLQFLSNWYILNVPRPNGHKLIFLMQLCTVLPCFFNFSWPFSPQLPPCSNMRLYVWHYNDHTKAVSCVVAFCLLVSSSRCDVYNGQVMNAWKGWSAWFLYSVRAT